LRQAQGGRKSQKEDKNEREEKAASLQSKKGVKRKGVKEGNKESSVSGPGIANSK
jgi:hypothetical protein